MTPGTKKDIEVAQTPDAGALALGAQKIMILVMGEEVRDIAYSIWSKSHDMCTYLNIDVKLLTVHCFYN